MSVSRILSPAGFTRRSVLTQLGIGAAGMMLTAPRLVATQESTPATGHLPPAIAEWTEGWRALDPARITAPYSETAAIVDMPTATTLTGREAIQAYLTQFFAVFDDFHAEIHNLFATKEWAAAEWVYGERYTGEFPGYPPGSGQPATVYGAEIIGLAGGQIEQDRRYYDVYGMLVQLGLAPAPEGTATPGR